MEQPNIGIRLVSIISDKYCIQCYLYQNHQSLCSECQNIQCVEIDYITYLQFKNISNIKLPNTYYDFLLEEQKLNNNLNYILNTIKKL